MIGAIQSLIDGEVLFDNCGAARHRDHGRIDADGMIAEARISREVHTVEVQIRKLGRIFDTQ